MSEVESSIFVAEAITKYGYGVVTMGVIITVFLIILVLIIHQNRVFTQNLIERNHKMYVDSQEHSKELKNSIDKLSKSVFSLTENYSIVLDSIIKQLSELEKKYETVTVQLIESVLNDKILSKRVYFLISKYVITLYLNKTIIAIIEHFDRNGLNTENSLLVFKNNISRELDKYKNITIEELSQLEFDTYKKELFMSRLSGIYEIYFNDIKDNILRDFKGCTEFETNHYLITKQQIKNKINEMSESIFIILKEILK